MGHSLQWEYSHSICLGLEYAASLIFVKFRVTSQPTTLSCEYSSAGKKKKKKSQTLTAEHTQSYPGNLVCMSSRMLLHP